MVVVTAFAASVAGPLVAIRATWRATRSAASVGRQKHFFGQVLVAKDLMKF
jgi:hypothetical protein